MNCHICNKEIDEKKIDSFVMIKKDNKYFPVETRHKGVLQEYDEQLGIKKPITRNAQLPIRGR